MRHIFYIHLRSSEQFVHEDAEGPEVHRPVVALVQDDLGRHVLGGAAEGPGLPPGVDVFGEPEVDHFNVTLLI